MPVPFVARCSTALHSSLWSQQGRERLWLWGMVSTLALGVAVMVSAALGERWTWTAGLLAAGTSGWLGTCLLRAQLDEQRRTVRWHQPSHRSAWRPWPAMAPDRAAHQPLLRVLWQATRTERAWLHHQGWSVAWALEEIREHRSDGRWCTLTRGNHLERHLWGRRCCFWLNLGQMQALADSLGDSPLAMERAIRQVVHHEMGHALDVASRRALDWRQRRALRRGAAPEAVADLWSLLQGLDHLPDEAFRAHLRWMAAWRSPDSPSHRTTVFLRALAHRPDLVAVRRSWAQRPISARMAWVHHHVLAVQHHARCTDPTGRWP